MGVSVEGREGHYILYWSFTSKLSFLGQLPARADESVLPRFVQRVFLLIGGTLYDIILFHGHWELSPLLPVPALGHVYLCLSSSTFTAVGSLLLFHLINRWDKI